MRGKEEKQQIILPIKKYTKLSKKTTKTFVTGTYQIQFQIIVKLNTL